MSDRDSILAVICKLLELVEEQNKEEEEEENETGNLWDPGHPQDEAWDQARNDWQKSQPSTGDPG